MDQPSDSKLIISKDIPVRIEHPPHFQRHVRLLVGLGHIL